MSDVEDRIKKLICEQLGVKEEEVTSEASFVEDLGADSLDTVELVMALEEEFRIQFTEVQIVEMMNYALIRNILKEQLVN